MFLSQLLPSSAGSEVENSDVLVSEVQLRRLSSLPGSSGEAACPSNVESEDDCVGLLTGESPPRCCAVLMGPASGMQSLFWCGPC